MKKVNNLLLLTLFVTFFGQSALMAANTLTNIKFNPVSPEHMQHNEKVIISYDYTISSRDGARIFVMPYTRGNPSPNYSISGSGIIPSGLGSGSGFITITADNIIVDQIRVWMTNPDQSLVLVEYYLKARYYYGNWVYNVQFTPASPALVAPGVDVNFTFDYVISAPGTSLIFGRPYTNGNYSPAYSAHGSDFYTAGKGSGNGYFTINQNNILVDGAHFEIMNLAQTQTYYETVIPVRFRFCNGNCVWHVKSNASGNQTGSDWTNAFRDLQDALNAADAGDEIWVANGAYYPDESFASPDGSGSRSASFTLKNNIYLYGGFAGTENNRNQRKWVTNPTILSGEIGTAGQGDNSYHVVTGDNVSGAILDGFTVANGKAEGSYPTYLGGGLLLMNSAIEVQNCTFKDNQAGAGAGLTNWGGNASTITNCTFINNEATGAGGAVNLQSSNPTFRGCLFLSNRAQNGGAVDTLNNSYYPVFENCLFSGNHATLNGGAIYNTATDGYNEYSPKLQNCTIANNTATGQGGGIYDDEGSYLTINSCIFWDNSDSIGNGQAAQYAPAGAAPAINYSCIQGITGSFGGTGNIGLNPWFVQPQGPDGIFGTLDDNYRLLTGSPCINTGDPTPSLNDPDGSRNDMGAYGGPWSDLTLGHGSLGGSGYVFTTIGNIPSAFITQLAPLVPGYINIQGTANVSATQAADFHIPQYQNSPFGSSLWIYGLFGEDDDIQYYKVQAGAWSGINPPTSFSDITDQLYKIRYYFDWFTWEWIPISTRVGPDTVGGVSNTYLLTRDTYWSHIDLRMIWNTAAWANGKYTLKIIGYHQNPDSTLTDVTPVNAQELVILVDNSPMTCTINKVKYDIDSSFWNPGNDGEIEECAIINLGNPNENLRFEVTASHPAGYLRQWTLDAIAGKNDYRGVIAQQVFNPLVYGPLWWGVTDQIFNTASSGSFLPWKRCAYQFRLQTWSRVNNGFYYIFYNEFSDHYFIDLNSGSGCSAADINKDGVVNLEDLNQLSTWWLAECSLPI